MSGWSLLSSRPHPLAAGLNLLSSRTHPFTTELNLLSSRPHPRARGTERNLLSTEQRAPTAGWGLLAGGEPSRERKRGRQSPRLQIKTPTGSHLGVETTAVVRELEPWEKTEKSQTSEAETSKKQKSYQQPDLTSRRPTAVEETTAESELALKTITTEEPLRTSTGIFGHYGGVPERRALETIGPLDEEERPSPDKSESR